MDYHFKSLLNSALEILHTEEQEHWEVNRFRIMNTIHYATNLDEFDTWMKKNRAQLNQSFGASVKRIKNTVCSYYVEKIIEQWPDVSSRDIDKILKQVTGHSINRAAWSGLITPKSGASRSKYTSDPLYRKAVHEHPLNIEFMENFKITLANVSHWKMSKTNPYKDELDVLIKEAKQRLVGA